LIGSGFFFGAPGRAHVLFIGWQNR
jgi:hypothetical protein